MGDGYSSFLAVAQSPLIKYKGPRSDQQCTAASLMESNTGLSAIVILYVGCLKRHVSRERPPRAASLSTSLVQTIEALKGVCTAISSLMIFYSKWVGDIALLLHRDSHGVLLTKNNLRN